ncbi:MAG TPA: CFI-box-CTERM domain-containing protein [Dehalococcoidia bacterium]|nr:CFI-box-CTERM domain-containing protein [Dehalococcoidia bacterium]
MKIKEIAVILLLGILLVTACTSSSTPPDTETVTADVQIITENLNCNDISLGPLNCQCFLTGTVRNIGDGDATSVVVKAEFFDTYGTRLGDESDVAGSTGDLSVGESASYSMSFKESECPVTYAVWAEWKESGDEGCFIATAAYGTSTAGEIDTLRAFRDEVLLQNSLGSQLVAFYYEVSPPVADFISEHEPLRTLVRELLVEPVVWVVEATGTPWQD